MTRIPKGAVTVISGRRSKYRNKKVEYDGYLWDSIRECVYYKQLKLMKLVGAVKKFEVKPKFYIGISPVKAGSEPLVPAIWCLKGVGKSLKQYIVFTYTPDFVVDGELVDVKGVQTPVFRLKKKILEALGLRIKLV